MLITDLMLLNIIQYILCTQSCHDILCFIWFSENRDRMTYNVLFVDHIVVRCFQFGSVRDFLFI